MLRQQINIADLVSEKTLQRNWLTCKNLISLIKFSFENLITSIKLARKIWNMPFYEKNLMMSKFYGLSSSGYRISNVLKIHLKINKEIRLNCIKYFIGLLYFWFDKFLIFFTMHDDKGLVEGIRYTTRNNCIRHHHLRPIRDYSVRITWPRLFPIKPFPGFTPVESTPPVKVEKFCEYLSWKVSEHK